MFFLCIHRSAYGTIYGEGVTLEEALLACQRVCCDHIEAEECEFYRVSERLKIKREIREVI